MCVIAVPVALAPVMSWGQRAPLRLIYALACIGTTLQLLRLAAALFQTGYLLAAGRFRFAIIGIWDWWFLVGTILFTLNTWRSRQWRNNRST